MQSIFGRTASERDIELAAARADGIPVEPAELAPMTFVADKDNAAPYYAKVSSLMKTGAFRADFDTLGTSWSTRTKTTDRSKFPAALAHLRPLLALVEAAGDKPGCDFRRNWSLGPNLLFPEYADIKLWLKALCVQAEQQSAGGDWRAALKSIERAETISHHCGADPIVIGHLVQIATEKIVDRSFEKIIGQHVGNARFVVAAQQTIAKYGPLPDYRRSLMGEVAMGRVAIPMIDSFGVFGGGSPGHSNALERTLLQSHTVQNAFDTKFLRAYRTFIERVPKDPRQWEKATLAAREMQREIDADNSLPNKINQFLFPTFDAAAMATGGIVTHRQLIGTTLKLIDVRHQTGRYPRLLPDYGKLSIDPYSGKPFRYRREGTGFLLYSIGADKTDDGGAPRDPTDSHATFDESVRIK
ncbi:hypothetical protein OP10G_1630 [Fimbriimonas ginsengisoli Gsoil 348]|uniref:Uncharacterized protein n=1 Tax=Fimbriimonas ginsengisoli Gsoil 348 TaxID=661478 RepID=A0A068NN67_FIMGI|nr:hypothetical protein OP10G_1630 [Fimbriimonas ginsengisoli Gsoil 348]